MEYDLIIVGAGPIGLACGLKARKEGLNYLVIEKGCLVNSLYHYPANMMFFSTSEKLEIGGVPFVSNNPKPVRAEALEYYRRVSQAGHLHINLFEEVLAIEPEGEKHSVKTTKHTYTATHIVIATGFFDIPVLLHIEGEHLPKVTHYYKEPHYYAGQKVVVAGANNSAVDAALETYRKGAEVTMIIKGSEIGPRVKYWVKPDIENRIKEGTIKVFFNATLQRIGERDVDIHTSSGTVTIENDFVIAMTGYQPDFGFLRKTGIELSGDGNLYPVYDKASQETNVKNIYLAGVVCGGMDTHSWFIENSRVHAETIIQSIMEKKDK